MTDDMAGLDGFLGPAAISTGRSARRDGSSPRDAVAAGFAASALLYGSSMMIPLPDAARTDFLLMIGANPMVSQPSFVNGPGYRRELREIPKRGGRVVVLDPRRTETARAFEHIYIRPDTDAWLLLSMLHVIFDEHLEDRAAITAQTRGIDWLRSVATAHAPAETEQYTGIDPETVTALARDFAAAERAVAYGRAGSNRGRHGTLVAFLLDALTAVTGNLDREGGALFGRSHFPAAAVRASDTYAKFRSRMGGFPDAFGMLPSNVIAHEINEPGEGQLRALFTLAANPMLSAPDPVGLADAFSRLELHVSIDLFLSNTARYADFVLPAVTFPEREDISIGIEMLQLASFVDYSERIVPPRGQAREDWKILDDIARAAGFAPYSSAPMRFLSRFGWRPEPMTMVDALLRLGPHGDLFGLRPHGISVKKLRRNRPEL